jgi:hypothetical protein
VEQRIGNFMPGRSKSLRGTPLSVPVHVFRGAIPVTPTFDPKHPALVATVTSDANGAYRVPLAPGRYTVVVEVDGELYLNSYDAGPDGRDYWSTLVVTADTWTDYDIAEDSGAFY